MPNCAAGLDERLGEALGAQQDHAGREQRAARRRRSVARRVGSEPMSSAGPDEVRLLGRRPRDAHHVRDEEPDQDDRVEQRDRALQRERQRVDGRDGEEGDLDRVRPVELDLVVERSLVAVGLGDPAHPPRGQQHHQRPADADQQPVAAGHVGQRERRVLVGVLARLPREHEVDGVLGQHRDQRQDGEGEALARRRAGAPRRPRRG